MISEQEKFNSLSSPADNNKVDINALYKQAADNFFSGSVDNLLTEEETNDLLHCLSEGELDFELSNFEDIEKEKIIIKKIDVIKKEYIKLNNDNLNNKSKLSMIEDSVDNLLSILNIDFNEYEEKVKRLVKEINNN